MNDRSVIYKPVRFGIQISMTPTPYAPSLCFFNQGLGLQQANDQPNLLKVPQKKQQTPGKYNQPRDRKVYGADQWTDNLL